MACAGYACSRNALAVLNVMYIIIACVIIGVAAYARLAAQVGSIRLMGGMIACGVFLLLVAVIGLIGALRHHQVLLFFYMIILFILFLFEFLIACLCLAIGRAQQETFVSNGWAAMTPDQQRTLQTQLNCCGFKTPANCSELPCCEGSTSVCCIGGGGTNSSDSGGGGGGGGDDGGPCPCATVWDVVSGKLNTAIKTAGIFGLLFSFTEFIGVWLAYRYRNQKDPRANPSAFL